MSIEPELDLVGLKQAGRVVNEALNALKNAVKPGMTTRDLDVIA